MVSGSVTATVAATVARTPAPSAVSISWPGTVMTWSVADSYQSRSAFLLTQ